MKKFLALILALCMVFALCACGSSEEDKGMTYAEFAAAEVESEVIVNCYVQDTQSWWEDTITVYAADEDGAYFIYNMACSEEDAAKLVPGTKIQVTGYKAEWAGEVEISDPTFTFLDGSYIAPAIDVTDKLADTEALAENMNHLCAFKGMTVEACNEAGDAFMYNWDGSGSEGNDLYFSVSKDGNTYSFCVESYLRGSGTEVYEAVKALQVGDVVDLEGYLYWYEGPQPHIISVAAAA